jgi:GT2 family glycosyltransferase
MPETLPVAIGIMSGGEIRMETTEALCRAVSTQTISQLFFVHSGPYLDNGRNDMIRVFNDPRVRERCTHLLMVDSDIVFYNDDIEKLYAACEDRAVVGGVYHSIHVQTPKPIVYEWGTNETGGKTLVPLESWEDYGDDEIVRVPAIGAGFLMIRYEVIDVLKEVFGEPQPWFTEPTIDGFHYGEDLAFCLRCTDSGFGVWAHRGVQVGHVKATKIGGR